MFEQTSAYSQLNLGVANPDEYVATWGQTWEAAHDLYANLYTSDGMDEIEEELFAERNRQIFDDLAAADSAIDFSTREFDSFNPSKQNIDLFNRALAGDKKAERGIIASGGQRDLQLYEMITQQVNLGGGKYKTDAEIYEAATQKARQIYDASNSVLARSDSWTAELVGTVTGSMTDPYQQIGLLLGGTGVTKTVLGSMFKIGVQEAAAGMAIETMIQPEVMDTMERIGVEYSAKEALTQIGLAGVGGFAIGGVLGGIGGAFNKKFGNAGNLADEVKKQRTQLYRDIDTGRVLKSDKAMRMLWEADALDQTIESIVKVTGRNADAGEVVNRLIELKAAEMQVYKQIEGATDKFDNYLAEWGSRLEQDIKYKLPAAALDRIRTTLARVENDPREYFKWQEPETKPNARQQKKADKKVQDKGYEEPQKKKLTKEQKVERDQLVNGLKQAIKRHEAAVESEKKLGNIERNILPTEVRKAAEAATGIKRYDSTLADGGIYPVIDKRLVDERKANADVINATPEISAPPPKPTKQTLTNDYLDAETLESDRVLFQVADDIAEGIDTPISVSGETGEAQYINGKALMDMLAKSQEGLEKVKLCMMGGK